MLARKPVLLRGRRHRRRRNCRRRQLPSADACPRPLTPTAAQPGMVSSATESRTARRTPRDPACPVIARAYPLHRARTPAPPPPAPTSPAAVVVDEVV